MKHNVQGFTLIELVVVMVILGVLAATALPKFMDATSQAHRASVAGVGGSLGSAVSLVKSQWVANGHTAAVTNLVGFGNDDIDTNGDGWPLVGIAGSETDAQCVNVWNQLLSAAPTVAAGAVPAAPTVDYYAVVTTAAADADGVGFCEYSYSRDNITPRRTITYLFNGTIRTNNPQ